MAYADHSPATARRGGQRKARMIARLAEAVLADEEQHTQADWTYEVRMGPEKAVEEDLREDRSRNEHELALVHSAGQANI